MKMYLYLLWFGMTLSSLFFYPLLSSLNQELYYFQWGVRDFWEFLICWLLMGCAFSFVYYYIQKIDNLFFQLISTSTLILLPFSFYLIQISRMAGLRNELILLAETIVEFKIIAIITLCISFLYIFYKRELFLRLEVRLVLIFSFLNIFFAMSSINTYLLIQPVLEEDAIAANSVITNSQSDITAKSNNIYFIVFDELSYQYIYQNGEVRDIFANINKLANESVNYHLAYAPGNSTMQSMPSYVAGEILENIRVDEKKIVSISPNGSVKDIDFSDRNIFQIAKSKGYQTALIGWYHDYCSFLHQELDFCKSFSLYKYLPIQERFSLLHPIATNLGLLPYQKPFGLLKLHATIPSHINTVNTSLKTSINTIEKYNPSFQLFHFAVPHSPFIYDGEKYIFNNNAYVQNDEYYNNQLFLVDNIVGQIVRHLDALDRYDSSTIILTSDHNYRIMFDDEENFRVPLIIKSSGSKEYKNDYSHVYVQNKIMDILQITN